MKIHENLLRGGGTPPSGGGYPPQKGSQGVEINEIGVSTVSPLGFGQISVDFQVFNEISLKSRGYPRETRNPSGNSHIKYSGAAEFPGCTWTPRGGYPPFPSSLMANAIKDEGNGGGLLFYPIPSVLTVLTTLFLG